MTLARSAGGHPPNRPFLVWGFDRLCMVQPLSKSFWLAIVESNHGLAWRQITICDHFEEVPGTPHRNCKMCNIQYRLSINCIYIINLKYFKHILWQIFIYLCDIHYQLIASTHITCTWCTNLIADWQWWYIPMLSW